MSEQTKICPKCGKSKPIEAFHSYFSKSRNKRRIGNYCKDCARKESNKRAKAHYRANVEKKKQYGKQYRADNKEKIKADRPKYKKAYREKLQDCYVRELLVTRSNISPEFIEENPEIIETKRLQLKLKRKLKSIRDGKK